LQRVSLRLKNPVVTDSYVLFDSNEHGTLVEARRAEPIEPPQYVECRAVRGRELMGRRRLK
jgi:hypothetical protein